MRKAAILSIQSNLSEIKQRPSARREDHVMSKIPPNLQHIFTNLRAGGFQPIAQFRRRRRREAK
jgi:hypothetical protein